MERRKSSHRDFHVLLKHRHYFGVEPLKLRAAAARIVARVAGLAPERARVTSRQLLMDFGIDTVEGLSLVDELVAEGLLQPRPELPGVYGVAPRFAEIAAARIVDPLPRERAKQLVTEACGLAAQINTEWVRIPLEIEALAPFGGYMSRDPQLSELSLGVVVRTAIRDPAHELANGDQGGRRDCDPHRVARAPFVRQGAPRHRPAGPPEAVQRRLQGRLSAFQLSA